MWQVKHTDIVRRNKPLSDLWLWPFVISPFHYAFMDAYVDAMNYIDFASGFKDCICFFLLFSREAIIRQNFLIAIYLTDIMR